MIEEKEKGESRRVNFGLGCERECNEEINRMKRELWEQIEREVKKLKRGQKNV